MPPSISPSVGIIGGGVIGLCCAHYLEEAGFRVTVFEEGDLRSGCSHLNAGMMVPSHLVPLAAPGMVMQGLRWLLHADSPFAIRPGGPRRWRWAWHFYRAATAAHVRRAVPLLRDISWLSRDLYRELAGRPGFAFGWEEKGLLMLYRSPQLEAGEGRMARLAEQAGVKAQVLSPAELQGLEPGWPMRLRGAVYYPGDAQLDPGLFMQVMAADLSRRGVSLLSGLRVQLGRQGGQVREVHAAGRRWSFDQIVVAAGARSAGLLRDLGLQLPLEGGKGYSFDVPLPEQGPRPAIPAILLEGRVAVTPMGGRLRVGGTLEIGGSPDTVHKRRLQGISDSLRAFYPAWPAEEPAQVSAGLRPCSPDGLPYIGRMHGHPRLSIATGHGMMGMSLGPATGKLISELLSGCRSSMDIQAFAPDRFR